MKIQAALIRPPRRGKSRPKKRPDVCRLTALLCLLTGLFGGAALFSLCGSQRLSAMESIFRQFALSSDASFGARTAACLLPSLGVGLLILYLGLSPFGAPGIGCLLVLRGCGVGALAVTLAQIGGKTGVFYYFLCLFPGKTLQLCGLFSVACHAMRLSAYIKSCLKRDSFQAEPICLTEAKACLPGLLLLVASALADAVLQQCVSPSFASLWR